MGGLKQRKEQEFTMIFRILSRVYLKQYHLCYVYNVLKLQPESKRLHIQATAQMLNAIKWLISSLDYHFNINKRKY